MSTGNIRCLPSVPQSAEMQQRLTTVQCPSIQSEHGEGLGTGPPDQYSRRGTAPCLSRRTVAEPRRPSADLRSAHCVLEIRIQRARALLASIFGFAPQTLFRCEPANKISPPTCSARRFFRCKPASKIQLLHVALFRCACCVAKLQ